MRNTGGGEAGELAAGLRRRDTDLLGRLIELYQYRLFRYLVFLTGRRDTAEDLFQETWMRVLEKGHLYNGRSKFESWLFSIAHNLFVDLVRRKKASISLEDLCDPEEGSARELSDRESIGPVEGLMRQEWREQAAAALHRLPAVIREALVLRFHEDLSLEEIATVVSAPLSTVKSRLYRGLELLRESMEGVAR